jgi:hypothetical protein
MTTTDTTMTTAEEVPTTEATCTCQWAKDPGHDLLLEAEGDPEALVYIFSAAVRWHENGWPLPFVADWLDFFNLHTWRNRAQMQEFFTSCTDAWETRRDLDRYRNGHKMALIALMAPPNFDTHHPFSRDVADALESLTLTRHRNRTNCREY